MNPWIVLDRDGVINETRKDVILELSDWSPIPGSVEAIVALSRMGYRLVVATNLAGLSHGLFSASSVEVIHQHLCDQVASMGGMIEGVFYCPHSADEGCDCRKPRTGMLDAIEHELGAELQGAMMVGDSLKDIQAARAKGCQPVLVRTGKGTQTETATLLWPKYGEGIVIFDDLAEFAKNLISSKR